MRATGRGSKALPAPRRESPLSSLCIKAADGTLTMSTPRCCYLCAIPLAPPLLHFSASAASCSSVFCEKERCFGNFITIFFAGQVWFVGCGVSDVWSVVSRWKEGNGQAGEGREEGKVVFKDNVEGLEGDKEPPEKKKKRNDDDDDKRIGTGRASGVEEQENRI